MPEGLLNKKQMPLDCQQAVGLLQSRHVFLDTKNSSCQLLADSFHNGQSILPEKGQPTITKGLRVE